MTDIDTKVLDMVERQGQVYIMFGYDDDEELLLELDEKESV